MTNNSKSFRMIAKTFAGLEKVLAEEIKAIGGENIKILQRAIDFDGDEEVLYKANYLCYSAIRIIKPIATFNAPDENVLYDEVKNINWKDYLDLRTTFSIDGNTSYSNISHSKYLALKSKDAIVDKFREETGKRPSVEKFNPDIKINVRIFKDICTVSIDSSGESLHKRGYRVETGPAPLNEVLGAGMILLSGWTGESNFIDPMCGSGTLPIEATMIAKQIPAGYFREDYAFKKWKDFNSELWERIREEAREQIIPLKNKIFASDWSGRIIQVAKANIKSAGLENEINIHADFFADTIAPEGKGVLITNPPYGERIKTEDIINLYKGIGDTLKQKYTGYSAWIISSHLEAIKHIGLRTSAKIKLFNGPLECSYVNFELYEGSKYPKDSKQFSDENVNKVEAEPGDQHRRTSSSTDKPQKKYRKRIKRDNNGN